MRVMTYHWTWCYFIYGSFNDAVSSSDYMVLNDMITEEWIRKYIGGWTQYIFTDGWTGVNWKSFKYTVGYLCIYMHEPNENNRK
jgi:hypothetical protein